MKNRKKIIILSQLFAFGLASLTVGVMDAGDAKKEDAKQATTLVLNITSI